MSEEMKNCSCSNCGMCSGAHSNKKHLTVRILMIIVIIMAFSLGMQIGELKGELRSFRGDSHSKMMRGYDRGNNDDSGPGMMRGYFKDVQSQAATPAPVK